MQNSELKNKAKRGVVWNTVERLTTNGIQFIITVLLARLLNPADYGVIAMPAIFLAFAQVLINSGTANALIRKQDLDEKDLSTAFYFNILVGITCYFILFFASPLIANFFNTPILSKLLKVTSLVVFINSLCIVQQALMTKRMDFKTQAIISAISTFVSGGIGIWMAYNGYGVWSLVFQQVSAALLRAVLLWILGHWHPIKLWSKESFLYLWNFGSKVIVIGILDTIYNNVYSLVLGKTYSAKDLGNYTRAQHFAELPINNVVGIVQKVTLPILSEIQNNNNRLSEIYIKLIEIVSLLVFPLMLCMAAVASPIIRILLGEEWLGCIIMLQILCFARIWTPINAININLLQVKGRTDLFLRIEVAKKAIHTGVLIITIFWGVNIMLLGYVLVMFLAFSINTYYTKKIIGLGFKKQLLSVLPMLMFSIVAFVLVLFFIQLYENLYIQLLVGILLYFVIILIFILFFKKNSFTELTKIILKK